MDIKELVHALRDIKELTSALVPNSPRSEARNDLKSPLIGKKVIIRTFSAGVHYGTLVDKAGTNVLLSDARRIWSWKGAFTLSEVATNGVDADGTRISCQLSLIELTEAIEIIPIAEKALDALDSIHEE